jgi:hypothetical protein
MINLNQMAGPPSNWTFGLVVDWEKGFWDLEKMGGLVCAALLLVV